MASAKIPQTAETPQDEVVNTVVHDDAKVAVRRYFTIPGRDPFEEVEWEIRDALIPGKDKPVFEQRGVEFPKFWSQTATNIVAQKYFRGRMGSPDRESSDKAANGPSNGIYHQAVDSLSPNNADSMPLPLLILAGLSLILIAAGGAGLVTRRVKARKVPS